jgi:hypothetical protein
MNWLPDAADDPSDGGVDPLVVRQSAQHSSVVAAQDDPYVQLEPSTTAEELTMNWISAA